MKNDGKSLQSQAAANRKAGQVSSSDAPTFGLLWRCYRFLLPYRRYVSGTYLTELVIVGINLAIPQFIRWIIDNALGGAQTARIDLLAGGTAALLSLTVLKGAAAYFQGRWSEIASQSVAFDLRNAIQNKLTLLSFSFHDQSETGQLLSRAIQDVDRIRFLTGRATLRIVDGVLLAVATAVLMVGMSPRLALLVTLTLPLLAHRALYLGSHLRPLSVRIQNQLGILTTRLEQNLRGARVVKAFAQEPAEIERFAGENETWFDLSKTSARIQSINAPLLDFLANLGALAIILYGGVLVIQKQLTIGELVAFSTYLGQLYNPVRMLGNIVPAIAQALSAAGRIFEILDAVADVQDEPGAVELPHIQGHVQFQNVAFAYGALDGNTMSDQRRNVLADIQFEAQPGQVIALLGATGSGKSTITNLIPRFYDPTQGRILIDRHDIRQVTLRSLRAQIGMVLQETTLFLGSIRENIAFGRQEVSDDEVIAAAQAAQAHEFIQSMPDGYATIVGERGATLSGGQKQRIALARALLTDPRILILDDATAAVDSETEQRIQQALDQLMEGRTSFVIAHRLSTVRRADLILVLEQGRIIARGTHAELLNTSPLYREVYSRQLKEQDPIS